MFYSSKIQEAVNFTLKAHQGQKRKSREVDFIMHPLIVGMILAKSGANEEIIIAGLLHDTIEDAGVTRQQIADKFGARAAEMVNDVTEQDKSLPWTERKRLALQHIFEMDKNSLWVKSADMLHNMTDFIALYDSDGDKIFKNFHAPKEKQLERYERAISAIEKIWPKNPLLPDLKENLERLEKMWR